MKTAIAEALKGEAEGGSTIGAVLIQRGAIVGRGHNRVNQTGNPTTHAEMEAIRDAGVLEDYTDTELYTTMMPCRMCAGAIIHFGIRTVVIGNSQVVNRTVEYMREAGVEVFELHDPECIRIRAEGHQRHPERYLPTAGIGVRDK
ncbi:MAG: nucleoside deaminase [Anaerolineae bacterium]|nr:nucleoside deaminase [Anaerolineae bacterium]